MTLTLTIDAWQGVHSNDETIEVSDWSQVQGALDMLDGRVHTQIALVRDDGSSLVVGGGPDRFNLYIESSDDRFHTLLDRSKATSGTERLVTGGQLGDFPAETVVGREAVVRAARAFFELGIPDATQDWDEY